MRSRIGSEENEALFIRVWRPLPSINIFKMLKESPKEKAQRGQYLLAMSLGHYQWYQSQTPDDVSTKRLSPKGGGHEAMRQQGRWAPNEGGLGIPHRLEKGIKVDCEIPHRLRNETFFIRCGNLPQQTPFKNLKGKFERESSKKTISVSNRLRLLQHK